MAAPQRKEPEAKVTHKRGTRPVSIERLRVAKTLARTEEFGNLEALEIESLDTASYQRTLKMAFVSRLASKWDMAIAGAILVNRRKNGKLYVIDGQHRVAAAQRVGETHILAQVLDGLTEKEEAALRIESNVIRGERAQERFKARLIAEDPQAVKIQAIVEELGGRIGFTMGDKNAVNAVATLDFIYERDGTGELLEKTMGMLLNSFDELNQHTASTVTIRGMAYLIENTPEMKTDRVVERLHLLQVEAMLSRANAFKSALAGSMWLNFARAVVETYNDRLAERNRIEFPRMSAKYKMSRKTLAQKKQKPLDTGETEAEEKEGANDEPSTEK